MTTGFMTSYKRQSSDREGKILKKSKKLKSTAKRTLELCTTLYVYVCLSRLYLRIIV